MRKDVRFADLSLREVYAFPSIAALGAHLERKGAAGAAGAGAGGPKAFCRLPRWKYALSSACQALMLYFIMGFFALQWVTPFMIYSFLKAYEYPFWESLLASLVSLCCVYPAMLLLGIACKWLLLGRLREGDYPVWGAYYLRWLFVNRLLSYIPIQFFAGTPLMALYLRLLGSKIGRDVYIDSHLISGLDLLSIGEGTSINPDANVCCHSLEDGLLKIRRVELGRNVSVGICSVIGLDVVVGDGAVIDDMTCVQAGGRLGPGERWAGSPAVRLQGEPREPGRSAGRPERGVTDAAASLFYSASFFVLPALGLLPIFPGVILMYHLDYRTENYYYLLLAPMIAVIFVVLSAAQIVALKWLILGRLKEGVHRINSLFYMRKWLVDKLMEISHEMLESLYATLYLNVWYRALGVDVGPRAEVSTASFILPDLLRIGEGSFIADGVGLGPAKVVGRDIVLRRTEIGSRTFIGNSAYVPVGSRIGDNCLLGCQSLPPGEVVPEGTSWVGSPALCLPRRQKPAKQFAEERTYRPTRRLYCLRLFIEFFRVILPATAFIVFTVLMLSFSIQIEDKHGPLATAAAFPAVYIGLGVAATLVSALLKRLLVGRYKPDEQPLWSTFVWRTELVSAFCENFTNEFFVQHLQGTVFLPWYFRLLGMKIGKRACLLTTDFTEFDLVRLGDDVALNEDCTIQTHLFEDRVMKMSTIDIGSRVSIGSHTLILYGTVIEDDVKVADLSLLMKGERLYRGSQWAGSPVKAAG